MAGYLTEPEAEVILSSHAPSLRDAWDVASPSDREDALATASKLIDVEFTFPGWVTSEAQEYSWPRTGATYFDEKKGIHVTVPDNVVPEQVKLATALLANHILKYGDKIFGYDPDVQSVSLESVSVGMNDKRVPKIPYFVRKVLRPLLDSRGSNSWFMAN